MMSQALLKDKKYPDNSRTGDQTHVLAQAIEAEDKLEAAELEREVLLTRLIELQRKHLAATKELQADDLYAVEKEFHTILGIVVELRAMLPTAHKIISSLKRKIVDREDVSVYEDLPLVSKPTYAPRAMNVLLSKRTRSTRNSRRRLRS
jgi:hypothetical protein